MLVKNWMNEEIITIDAKDSMLDAINLLKEHNIRMLPVMEKGKLADMVILTKNPLADIRNSRSIEFVMKNGVLLPQEKLSFVQYVLYNTLSQIYTQDGL